MRDGGAGRGEGVFVSNGTLDCCVKEWVDEDCESG